MALLIDKCRPRELQTLEFHAEVNRLLGRVAQSGDFPHVLLFGPSGAGKKTRALCALRAIFGAGAEKVRTETKTLKTNSGTSFSVEVTTSSYHFEVAPGELGGSRDAIVVQSLIKEAAQSPPPVMGENCPRPFKVVVIHDADTLSRQAQAGLRRTMEKYISTCRLILLAENFSRLIAPIRSRCLCIRVARPEIPEIERVLSAAASDENIKNVNVSEISSACSRDLRRALLLLDVARVSRLTTAKLPWEQYIEEISRDVVTEQTPRVLLLVRNKLYDLLGAGIPAETIFARLARSLPPRQDLLDIAAEFEHSARLGSKPIFHLEAYVAGVMAALRQ